MAANERTILYLSHAPEAMYAMARAHLAPGLRLITLAADDDAERFAALPHADAILVGAQRLRADYIAAAPKLRLVQHQGVGWHDTVDHAALAGRGIRLAINPLGTAETVAEHTIMLMLAALRHLGRADAATRRGEWLVNHLRPISRNLRGLTVGLVGMGRIGSTVAALLQPFRVRGLYCDPYVTLPEGIDTAIGFARVELDALLAESDLVSLHVPATAETRRMIRAETIARMKPGAFLVNTCRGPVVDTDDLVAALASGRLAGAGLDVFEPEPLPPGHPLYALENVTITPHTAAGTRDTMAVKMREAMENIARFLDGGPLAHEVSLR
jgi:phosphoglycerate dehydrogenase-like enzyme